MEDLKSLSLWLVPPYSIFIASLYYFSFWSAFDVNIFEYASIPEILLVSISTCLITVPLVFIGFFLTPSNAAAKIFNKHGRGIQHEIAPGAIIIKITVLLFGLLLPFCWFLNFYWLYLLATGIPIMVLALMSPLGQIQNRLLKKLAIILIVFFPLAVFITGKENAHQIQSGSSYWAMTMEGKEYRLIGHSGQKTFFVKDSGKTLIIIPDNEKELTLTKVNSRVLVQMKIDQFEEMLSKLAALVGF